MGCKCRDGAKPRQNYRVEFSDGSAAKTYLTEYEANAAASKASKAGSSATVTPVPV
ncbi:unannotated protein [freshwater metagenome]|uniref:Unannotated protein n=1 Tax=freshwater metagenome TaxID=449393 RepID=A0A6J7GUC4_9ZZZZ|nr:hypothetical protein [Actinomycetota bacterium]